MTPQDAADRIKATSPGQRMAWLERKLDECRLAVALERMMEELTDGDEVQPRSKIRRSDAT